MRTVNNATLASINMGFRLLYLAAYRAQVPIADRIADVRDSSSLEEAIAILSTTPRMREWIGEREVKNLTANLYTIKNKDWESTIEVDRNDIEDDRIGIYRPQIADMGKNAALIWDDLVVQALKDGEASLCYDGQYFFDTDHPVDIGNSGSAVQSNLFAGRPLTLDNYAYVRSQMTSYKLGPDGRKLRVTPNILLVGSTNEVIAKEIVGSDTAPDTYGGTKTNVLKGSAQVVVDAEFDDEWFLIDATNAERPIVVAKRKSPEFVEKTNATDDAVFWRRKYHYGVDARGVAGYGPWFLAAKAKP